MITKVMIEAQRVEGPGTGDADRPFWLARFAYPSFFEVEGTGYSLVAAVQNLYDLTVEVTLTGVEVMRDGDGGQGPAPAPDSAEGFCGCCGREADGEWCRDCRSHVLDTGEAYRRTYYAQHKVDCPYQVEDEAP